MTIQQTLSGPKQISTYTMIENDGAMDLQKESAKLIASIASHIEP